MHMAAVKPYMAEGKNNWEVVAQLALKGLFKARDHRKIYILTQPFFW